MSRNVAGHWNRRCALVRQRLTFKRPGLRAYSTSNDETIDELSDIRPPQSRAEDKLFLLRVAEQSYLRDTKAHLNELISSINAARSQVDAVFPATIQHDPKIAPYIVGYPRRLASSIVPEYADKSIAAAQRIIEHLEDLQYEPYPDESKTSLVEFERSINNDSVEEKAMKLKTFDYENEAMQARSVTATQSLLKTVQDIVERGTKSGDRKIAASAAEQASVQEATRQYASRDRDVEPDDLGVGADGKILDEPAALDKKTPSQDKKKRKVEVESSRPTRAPTTSLSDLQQQLAANINRTSKG